MRSYSLRSSYPLARSSQARRRLVMLYKQYQAPAEAVETEESEDDEEASLPPSVWEPVEVQPPRLEDERRPTAAPVPPLPEEREWDLVDSQAFLDEIFRDSEARNEALKI